MALNTLNHGLDRGLLSGVILANDLLRIFQNFVKEKSNLFPPQVFGLSPSRRRECFSELPAINEISQ